MKILHGKTGKTYNSLCRKHFGCLKVMYSNLAPSSRSSFAMRFKYMRDWFISREEDRSAHC